MDEDEEEERPAKRRKIADDDGNNQNITIEEPLNDDLPLEVISMVFDHLDLTYVLKCHVLTYQPPFSANYTGTVY